MYTITYHLECPFISKSLEGLETEVAQPLQKYFKNSFFFLKICLLMLEMEQRFLSFRVLQQRKMLQCEWVNWETLPNAQSPYRKNACKIIRQITCSQVEVHGDDWERAVSSQQIPSMDQATDMYSSCRPTGRTWWNYGGTWGLDGALNPSVSQDYA